MDTRVLKMIGLLLVCALIGIHHSNGRIISDIDPIYSSGIEIAYLIILFGIAGGSAPPNLDMYFSFLGAILFAICGGFILRDNMEQSIGAIRGSLCIIEAVVLLTNTFGVWRSSL